MNGSDVVESVCVCGKTSSGTRERGRKRADCAREQFYYTTLPHHHHTTYYAYPSVYLTRHMRVHFILDFTSQTPFYSYVFCNHTTKKMLMTCTLINLGLPGSTPNFLLFFHPGKPIYNVYNIDYYPKCKLCYHICVCDWARI